MPGWDSSVLHSEDAIFLLRPNLPKNSFLLHSEVAVFKSEWDAEMPLWSFAILCEYVSILSGISCLLVDHHPLALRDMDQVLQSRTQQWVCHERFALWLWPWCEQTSVDLLRELEVSGDRVSKMDKDGTGAILREEFARVMGNPCGPGASDVLQSRRTHNTHGAPHGHYTRLKKRKEFFGKVCYKIYKWMLIVVWVV